MMALLPRILVVDDQLGSDADLREEFCRRCGLIEATINSDFSQRSISDDIVASAVFSSGQLRNDGIAQNSIEVANAAVASGWPADGNWRWALVLLDLRFEASKLGDPEDDTFGLRILENLVRNWPDKDRPGACEMPIVVLSSIERAKYGGRANRGGAAEYVEKNLVNRDKLISLLTRHGLIEDQRNQLLGRSFSLLKVLRTARGAGEEAIGNQLILGEPGAGKSLLARYIYENSKRSVAPFQSITVSPGMEPHLLKTQLFGFWYGAYTPADKSEAGLAERAHRGTLFIDEIANLPAGAHQELLEYGRLDRDGRRRLNRLGVFPTFPKKAVDQARGSICGDWERDTQAILVDVFLITATNKPIADQAFRAKSGFPDDLFVRLGQEYHSPIHFPALRERRDDIAAIFCHFLAEESSRSGGVWPKSIDQGVFDKLRQYSWPGNVAELAGVAREVERSTRPWEEVHLRHMPILADKSSSSAPAANFEHDEKRVEQNDTHSTSSTEIGEAIEVLHSVKVNDSRRELEGSLRTLSLAYGSVLERLLSAALELTRDRSARDKDDVLGDLSPTRAINLLLNESLKTDKAADEIKRLSGLLSAKPSADSDLGRVIAWAFNLRKGGRRPRKQD